MNEQQAEAHRSDDRRRNVRLVVAAIVVALIVAVAVDNREEVSVGYVIGDVNAPVWVVLVAAGHAGVVIGWLLQRRPGRGR